MADAIEIYLVLSRGSGAVVKGLNDGTAVNLGPFYQGQLLRLRVFPVVDAGGVIPAPGGALFTKVSITNMELRVAVGPAAGAEAVKAYQPTFSKQVGDDSEGKSGYFYADLDLNTTDMNTAVGVLPFYDTYIEFGLQRSGATTFAPVYQQSIRVLAVVKDPGSASSTPTPTDQYLTAAQCYNLFVAWRNDLIAANAGRNVVFLSPDSAHTREIGVGNAAEPIDNPT